MQKLGEESLNDQLLQFSRSLDFIMNNACAYLFHTLIDHREDQEEEIHN